MCVVYSFCSYKIQIITHASQRQYEVQTRSYVWERYGVPLEDKVVIIASSGIKLSKAPKLLRNVKRIFCLL